MKTNLLCIAFAVLMTTVAVAQDAPEKKKRQNAAGRNNPATAVLKQLQDAGLTEEQQAKIKEMAKKAMTEMRTVRKDAGITPELMKQRTEAMKELREGGTKPAEMFAAVNKKLGLSEEQAAALKKTDELRQGLLKGAMGLLSEEQKAKLPKRLTASKNAGNANAKGQAKGKGKKKKSE